jgi:hypothetical protein
MRVVPFTKLHLAKCKYCKQPAKKQWRMDDGEYIAVCLEHDKEISERIYKKVETIIHKFIKNWDSIPHRVRSVK